MERLLERRADLAGDAQLQPTIRAFGLPREPFLRLIEANRMDQRDQRIRDLGRAEALLRPLGRPGRAARARRARAAGDAELVAASDDVCTGLQLVNFLQDVPRDLALGRIYLPAEDRRRFGVARLDRPSDELRALLRFEAERARGCSPAGSCCARGSAAASAARSPLFARGGLAALDALEEADWDVFTRRPRPSRARLAREAALVLVR